jgi:release factor glutamine methyltransferase
MRCDPGETVGAFLCQAGQVLRAAAVESPRLEARLLLGHAMGASPEALLRDPGAPVPPEAASRFWAPRGSGRWIWRSPRPR